MTKWNSIYASLGPSKLKYKTFRSKLDKRFLKFVTKQTFPKKVALDIGCGEGEYVKYLARIGFAVDAIDASAIAVAMTKKASSGFNVNVRVADMFKSKLPLKKYSLVLSIATIGHGYKKEITKLINKIHKSLLPNGQIFITLFDIGQARSEKKLLKYKKITDGAYAPRFGREKGVIHSFYNENETHELFRKFNDVTVYAGGDCALYITAIK